jgi:hypothetical protein
MTFLPLLASGQESNFTVTAFVKAVWETSAINLILLYRGPRSGSSTGGILEMVE